MAGDRVTVEVGEGGMAGRGVVVAVVEGEHSGQGAGVGRSNRDSRDSRYHDALYGGPSRFPASQQLSQLSGLDRSS